MIYHKSIQKDPIESRALPSTLLPRFLNSALSERVNLRHKIRDHLHVDNLVDGDQLAQEDPFHDGRC